MNGQENIIKKIADDAASVVAAINSENEGKINALRAECDQKCAAIAADAERAIAARTAEIAKSRETVTDLDIKKGLLGMRREVIDSVFEKVADALHDLPKDKYLSIISGMIEDAAEDGDVVVISKADKKIITADFIKKVAAKLKISLSLADECGDFAGGILLKSRGYDKNLTVEVETEILREEIETKIAELLFA